MEEGLEEINVVSGVRGSFICDNRGEVIVSATPPDVDMATLNSIGREVTQTMAGLSMAGEAVTELDFTYDGARLVAHELAKAVLVVLCEPQVEIAMLRLTLSVVIARLKSDGEVQSQLEASLVEKELTQDKADEISWHLLQALIERREVNNA
jgi:predicted regulator of Ras-like GTPase activity (Roadblock/LC7/MglB family)